jgi:hypothetical protein
MWHSEPLLETALPVEKSGAFHGEFGVQSGRLESMRPVE